MDKKKIVILVICAIITGLIIGLFIAFGKENAKEKKAVKQEEKTTEESKTEKADATGNENNNSTQQGDTQQSEAQQSEAQKVDAQKGGALKVKGTKLVDSKGNTVQLKGLSTHGIAWFPDYINQECFRQLHEEFGINVIRLAMYTAEYNGYCEGGNQTDLKQMIDRGVQYATNNNMYVIIDWHTLSDNNPNTYIEQSKQFFEEVSKKYAANDNVIYEICNEPNGSTSWEEIKQYAEQIIPIIRKNSKNSVILVGTPNWSQRVDLAADNPIKGYDNIMYTLHFYAATHKDDIRNNMNTAISKGLPIFVSEYGICDASGNGAIDEEQASIWIDIMNKNSVSYVMWNISNKGETSAIFNQSCSKYSGFTESDLSSSGKWFLNMMKGNISGAKTENNTPQESKSDTNNEANNTPDNSNSQANTGKSYSNVSLPAKCKLTNSWESDGKKFYQYDIVIENNKDGNVENWNSEIKFNKDVKISQSWNGNMKASGKKISISYVDYNKNIEKGKSLSDIGIIIEADKGLEIK